MVDDDKASPGRGRPAGTAGGRGHRDRGGRQCHRQGDHRGTAPEAHIRSNAEIAAGVAAGARTDQPGVVRDDGGLHPVPYADHGLKVPRSAPVSPEQAHVEMRAAVLDWLDAVVLAGHH